MIANGLITSKLILERLEPAHADVLFPGLCDEQLYEFIDAAPPDSVIDLRSRYERLAAGVSPDARETWLNWVIRVRSDGRYAGFVQATVPKDRPAEIAYMLLRSFWGNGYGIEAVTAMLDYLCKGHGIKTFHATVDPRNVRSVALLEKLGFQRISYQKNRTLINGIAAEESVYSFSVTFT